MSDRSYKTIPSDTGEPLSFVSTSGLWAARTCSTNSAFSRRTIRVVPFRPVVLSRGRSRISVASPDRTGSPTRVSDCSTHTRAGKQSRRLATHMATLGTASTRKKLHFLRSHVLFPVIPLWSYRNAPDQTLPM